LRKNRNHERTVSMTSIIDGIKGILIGIALVIPGLSGSIFAVVVGLYDKILLAVSGMRKEFKKSALFLLPVALGCVVGILASTKAVLWLCETFRLQAYSFFVGLVLGSLPLVLNKIKKQKFDWVSAVIAVLSLAAILIVGAFADSAGASVQITAITSVGVFLDLFVSGMAICALMMIPGVSGSVMLMLIGKYETIYRAVSCAGDFLRAVAAGRMEEAAPLFANILVVIPFLIGALVGLALVAKAITWLLKRYEAKMYCGVLGLVSGAAVSLTGTGVWPNLTGLAGTMDWALAILWIVVFVVVGWLCTTLLDTKEKPKEESAAE